MHHSSPKFSLFNSLAVLLMSLWIQFFSLNFGFPHLSSILSTLLTLSLALWSGPSKTSELSAQLITKELSCILFTLCSKIIAIDLWASRSICLTKFIVILAISLSHLVSNIYCCFSTAFHSISQFPRFCPLFHSLFFWVPLWALKSENLWRFAISYAPTLSTLIAHGGYLQDIR